ncbi:AraC family transcriptional regulator [Aquimarina gracilis]|uniref:AraC family transcriptional regulator n=1 Tax=Aquimarina gracilis TaxID=874422 RepID=A0ABU5ZSR0_9FLAO|nr:AraC family transcriptional regulator [Aquimarina gracilis]MEB3345125.1 AraC family transcriptional regulator [Aquimarina gracilis]
MKALPFKIPKSTADTLIVQEDKGATFYDAFHQHEEIQISWIVSGEGSLIVGDTVTSYRSDDILIFGSHVPHVLKSSASSLMSYMISVFFTRESFGEKFFNLVEFENLSGFFNRSGYGIRVTYEKEKLKKRFLEIHKKKNRLDRLIIFLQILKILGQNRGETISNSVSKKNYSDNEGQRMAKVFQLVMNNFYRDITLSEVSGIANMTPNAFCRYFRQRTNKTFFQFLTEVRIENCCNLLSKDQEISIAEVSYSSGFKNLSHFNRKFKKIKGLTPSQFKKNLNF